MGKRFRAALVILPVAAWCSSAWGKAVFLSIWRPGNGPVRDGSE